MCVCALLFSIQSHSFIPFPLLLPFCCCCRFCFITLTFSLAPILFANSTLHCYYSVYDDVTIQNVYTFFGPQRFPILCPLPRSCPHNSFFAIIMCFIRGMILYIRCIVYSVLYLVYNFLNELLQISSVLAVYEAHNFFVYNDWTGTRIWSMYIANEKKCCLVAAAWRRMCDCVQLTKIVVLFFCFLLLFLLVMYYCVCRCYFSMFRVQLSSEPICLCWRAHCQKHKNEF